MGNITSDSETTEETSVIAEIKQCTKKLHICQTLEQLLEEHKAQSLIVSSIEEELNRIHEDPAKFFRTRKKFLYYAYTQNLKECKNILKFDVKVTHSYVVANEKLDASFAITDREVGLVFEHIYDMSPQDALTGMCLSCSFC